ncbi:MAG: LptF/LptG family permease, partial [Deltaproteobacteria bacterium]|nr:LptF/LptG family permease [Deltaproteobacteria bacterium]
MRLLNRYILMDFITYFMACFLSILSIAVTFFILAELGTLNRDDGLLLFIDNILQSVPLIIEIIIPISVLLGTVITFVLLSKSSEITAMISAGVSHVQLLKPVLLFAVVICGFTYVNQSYLAPWWGSDTKMNIVSGKSEESIWRFYRGQIFYFKNPKKYIKKVDQGRIYRFNPDNGIAETEIMSHLKQTGSQWNIQSGVKISQD